MKTNATQLMISADPLTIYISTKNYKNRLSSFVDNFFVGIHTHHLQNPHITNPSSNELNELHYFFENLIKNDDNIKFIFPKENTTEHGKMLRELLKVVYNDCKENILITETDDFFLNTNELLKHIEALNRNEYDFVGEPRGCTNNDELIEFEKKVLIEDNIIVNNNEPGRSCFAHYWPTHFLIKKQHIKPDDKFEAVGNGEIWGNSENKNELTYRGRKFLVKENTCGDTFVKFNIEMMNRINKGYEYHPYNRIDCSPETNLALYYLERGLVNTLNYEIPTNIFDIALEKLSLHIGSASALQLFPILNNRESVLNQGIFNDIENCKMNKDENGLIELYRRFYLYQAAFESVQNDLDFEIFKERCIKNFEILNEYFEKINIKQIMDNNNRVLLPKRIYVNLFKHIMGYNKL